MVLMVLMLEVVVVMVLMVLMLVVVGGGSEVSAPPLRLAATRSLTHQIEFLTVYFALYSVVPFFLFVIFLTFLHRSAAFADFLRQQACGSVIRRAPKEAEVGQKARGLDIALL